MNDFRVTMRKTGATRSMLKNSVNRSYLIDSFDSHDEATKCMKDLLARYVRENQKWTNGYIIYLWNGDQLLWSRTVKQYRKEITK